MTKLPKYTENKMKGNIGEAFVQYVLSEFCLVHKIDGSNDVGNDMICELVKNEYPTNLLFYVQVKYTIRKPTIGEKTLGYWEGSPIPVYVFWVKDKDHKDGISESPQFNELLSRTKYKRYTPIIHGEKQQNDEKFINFDRTGFLNCLVEDYVRCQYRVGFTPIISPRDFLTFDDKVLLGLPKELFIENIVPSYRKNILENSSSNLLGIVISLFGRWDEKKNEKDRILALDLIKMARTLMEPQENFGFRQKVSNILDQYEKIFNNDIEQK